MGGQTVPNLTFATLGSDRGIEIYNGSTWSVEVIVDLLGYYS